MENQTNLKNLPPEIVLMFQLLSQSEKPVCLQKNYDWDYFSTVTHQLRVAPLVYKRICDLNLEQLIPERIFSIIKQQYYKTLQKNTILYHAFTQIHTLCAEKNISIVPLKGIFLADYVYGDIGIRPLSDIDILVNKKNISTCVGLLTDIGFSFDTRFQKSEFIEEQKESKHIPLLAKQGVGVNQKYGTNSAVIGI